MRYGVLKRLERLRDQEEDCIRSINSLDKNLFTTKKNVETLSEAEQRCLGELTFYGYSQPLEDFDGAEIMLQQLSQEYEGLRNNVNLLADNSYKDIFGGYKNLSLRRNQLETERKAIVSFIENIDAEKKRVFMDSFKKVDRELRTIFSRITGGSAWLEIENPDHMFSSGIFLMTQFPGKIPREASSTSGGEKTVSTICLILAIHSIYTAPFYLFDEVDAHLDLLNSEKLADLLRERSQNSQIIFVSLKDSTVSRASLINGIYIREGVTGVVRYRPQVEMVAMK